MMGRSKKEQDSKKVQAELEELRAEVKKSRQAFEDGHGFDVSKSFDYGQSTRKFMRNLKQPLHGEFCFEGSSAVHKYVCMPPGSCAQKKELRGLLRHWNLKKPNLILQTNYCCHAANQMVSEEMMADVEGYQALSETIGGEGVEQHQLMNEFLHSRLLSLWTQISRACAMTNSWIVLKGASGRGANDELLAEAMSDGVAKPTFLDIMNLADTEQNAGFFEEVVVSAAQAQEFCKLLVVTADTDAPDAPKREVHKPSDEPFACVCMGKGENTDHPWQDYALWAVMNVSASGCFASEPDGYQTDLAAVTQALRSGGTVRFMKQGWSTWRVSKQAWENNQALLARAKPLNVPFGEPVVIKHVPGRGHLHRPGVSQMTSEGCAPNKECIYWSYCNVAANYHIFTLDTEEFDENALGNAGFIFMGGNSPFAVKPVIKQAIHRGSPCILLDNTMGETQEYARLLRGLKAHDQSKGPPKPLDFLTSALAGQRKIPDCKEALSWFQHMDVVDALEVCNRYAERPDLFEETIVVVDPLTRTPDELLSIMSKCFASVVMHSSEVGAGPADKRAVLDAWHIHQRLVFNAQHQRWWADFLAMLAIAITFFATLVAIIDAFLDNKIDDDSLKVDVRLMYGLKVAVVVLPALGGLVAAFIAEGSALSKWAKLQFSAALVTSEIYRFRMRIGCYSLTGDQDDSDDGDTSMRMLRARTTFSEKVQTILKSSTSGVMTDQPLRDFEKGKRDVQHRMDAHALNRHVMTSHYERLSMEDNIIKDDLGGRYKDDASMALLEAGSDDVQVPPGTELHVSTMTNEDYVLTRVLKLLHFAEQEAPRQQCRYLLLRTCILVSATVATVLGAFKQSTWIPIAVSASTVFTSLLGHFNYKTRLNSTNSAVGELAALQNHWESLSGVARRLEDTRAYLVICCENAALSMASAWTGETLSYEHLPGKNPQKEK